jgi:flavin reductase (DIM6/NTAB) family NADH-FMN oxidoreductase RutF
MSIDQAEFRHILGHFASGVAIVTTHHAGSCHGTTVSSFCSLSLKPPLVLVCIDHTSTSHDLIMASSAFGVNILAEQGEWLSRHFASRAQAKFSDVPHQLGQTGVPLLEEAIATLECRVVAHYPGGDHSIFIGEVITASAHQDRQPLLYFRSRYNRLGEQGRT